MMMMMIMKNTNDQKLSFCPIPMKKNHHHHQHQSDDLEKKTSHNHVKNATCLICSIISQLSSFNCCPEHLSSLKNPSTQWLPEQVMIVPITNEIVQRYLDPQQIHHLRTQTSTSPTTLIQKSSNKSTMIVDLSESQQPATKSPQKDMPPIASTIVIESARSKVATVPPDITTIASESSVSIIDNVENITTIDADHPTITIDDTQQEKTLKKPINDPWIPISDEIDAALEQALDQIDSPSSDTPLEFTPATARRTNTEYMAERLPKLQLKEGRFRRGRPIVNRTASNAANEYRPLAATQSSPPTSSVITTSVRSPPTTTNVEKESNVIDNHIDSLLTQDETDQLPTTTRTNGLENENNRSNEIQDDTSSTTNERTTPSRISYRMNPDGTRVSISKPPLPTNPQSPLINLRRTSTDVTPIPKQV